jgi:hypothetical protein
MMHSKGFDSVVQAGKKLRLGTQSRHMDLVELTWEGGGGVGPRKKDRRRDGIKEVGGTYPTCWTNVHLNACVQCIA